MDPARLHAVYQALVAGEADDAAGVRLIRWRETLTENGLELGGDAFRFQVEGQLSGSWLHQFLRPAVLREVFTAPSLPAIYNIRDVQNAWVGHGAFKASARMLVPSVSLMHFAEPCKKGRLLSAARSDLEEEGCMAPDYEVIEAVNVYSEETQGGRGERSGS